MMIRNRDKIAFIHPYKTGGTSVSNYLSKHEFVKQGRTHSFASDYDLTGHYVISIIRPPHDRMVSLYSYCRGWKPFIVRLIQLRRIHPMMLDANKLNFTDFVLKYGRVLGKQRRYYIDANDNVIVDYMIRLPFINEDFNKVCNIIGIPTGELPHKHKSSHRADIKSYYTEETWNIVSERWADDMAEYEKWNQFHG